MQIARALASVGRLEKLITDVWVTTKNPINRIPIAAARRIAKRFHTDIDRRKSSSLQFEVLVDRFRRRFTRADEEAFYSSRNDAFDRLASNALDKILDVGQLPNTPIVFSYAHACAQAISTCQETWLRNRAWPI